MMPLWILVVLLTFSYSGAHKILVVFPLPEQSHGILGARFVRHLLNYGHEVTYITPFIEKYTHPNQQQVDVSRNLKLIPENPVNLSSLISKEVSAPGFTETMNFMNLVAVQTLENENVQKLLKNPNLEFDLVILEWNFSELLAGIAAVFDVPYIWVSNLEPHWLIARLAGESFNPIFNSNILSPYIPPLNLYQRVEELWTQITFHFHMYWYNDRIQRNDYERFFGDIIRMKGRESPLFEELKRNGSFVLGNSHLALGHEMRFPNNYKNVGGYHVDEEVKPLSPKLEKLMNNAADGVIYFSMGSKLKSEDLPVDIKKGLMKMFGELKQTVLWKLDDKSIDPPSNVHIFKRVPQQSLLAHSKCVLFITHGGILSTIEAVHYGVPIIGIPAYGDQFLNIERLVRKDQAKRVDLSHSLVADLKYAIDELLNTKRYNDTAKNNSFIFTHRTVNAGAEIVHWVEHVILTKGAKYLRTENLDLHWYQKLYLDLGLLLISAFLFLTYTCKLFLIFISKTRKVDVKKKKK
ncbi:UDP-glucosyltransferase precursor [Bombyx mori]|uniref:UDP-glucosyltransferase n=2 Tax=Bombyx mori TaxID=7091 RepID=D6RUU9_BOMMO|nr:UDP-glucosyltransferase precursor [Bombyx mori]BAJ08156.1 UDP-glucosyltransferase [Bombyx mori]